MLISQTLVEKGEKGVASLNYMLSQNYYKSYKQILKKANISVIPESADGKSSDTVAMMSMMMNMMQEGNGASQNASSKCLFQHKIFFKIFQFFFNKLNSRWRKIEIQRFNGNKE